MDISLSTVLTGALSMVYGLCVTVLFLFGLNSIILSIIYLINRKRIWQTPDAPLPQTWPPVTVQLPLFNERYMIRRLLEAVSELDYPPGLLQIQVLDDSNDSTRDLARPLVYSYQRQGLDIQYIHRSDRSGFKAGALNEGLRTATGEFIAIFDADFVPPRDWLRRVIPHFADPRVGFVQTRWGHANDRINYVTRMQSLALDGHFVIEQGARFGAELLMSFNGSGGIWRRAAIADSGGWSSETLTEDLDLSYRAGLRGWKAVYLPQVVVPAEVPANIDAVKKQQNRWAKGTVQVMRRLFSPVFHSSLPLGKRYMALMHLMMYLPFPLMVTTLLLVLPVGLVNPRIFFLFPFTALASLGPPLLYSLAQTEHLPRLLDRLVLLPGLILLGVGISINCSIGALAGLFHDGGVFERTPKYDLRNGQSVRPRSSYLLPTNPVVWAEIAMGCYNLTTLYLLWPKLGPTLVPWLLPSALGFFLVAWLTFRYHWRKPGSSSDPVAGRKPLLFR